MGELYLGKVSSVEETRERDRERRKRLSLLSPRIKKKFVSECNWSAIGPVECAPHISQTQICIMIRTCQQSIGVCVVKCYAVLPSRTPRNKRKTSWSSKYVSLFCVCVCVCARDREADVKVA